MKTIKIFAVLWAIIIYIGLIIMFGQPIKQHIVYAEKQEVATTTIAVKKEEIQKPKIIKVNKSKVHIEKPEVAKLKEVAKEEAIAHGVDPKIFTYIVACESSFNTDASHDGGNGKGITGFWKETFERWNKKFFNGELDYNNQEHQLKLMARAFAEGEEYRNDWSSWNKYKKYGTCYNYEIKKIKQLSTK